MVGLSTLLGRILSAVAWIRMAAEWLGLEGEWERRKADMKESAKVRQRTVKNSEEQGLKRRCLNGNIHPHY